MADYAADLKIVEAGAGKIGYRSTSLEFFEDVEARKASDPEDRWYWLREYIADAGQRVEFINAYERVCAGFRAMFAPV